MESETFITIPNFEKWQHYKDRCPPWIKLHRDILNDYKFSRLQDASKAHLVLIWLLASQMENRIPNDPKWIAQRIGSTSKVDVEELQTIGFIKIVQSDSNALADCKQDGIGETEAEAYKPDRDRDIKDSCAEPLTPSTPDEPESPILKFPVIGKEKTFSVYRSDIEEWKETYLGVDVLMEVKKCRQWNVDNPTKRKTIKGIRTHISSWLGRAQDGSSNRGRRQPPNTPRVNSVRDKQISDRDKIARMLIQTKEQSDGKENDCPVGIAGPVPSVPQIPGSRI